MAGHIHEVLNQERPERWSFAAPSEIHEAVLAKIEPRFRNQLVEQVMRDLVNVLPQQVLEHFSSVGAAPEAG